MPHNPWEAAADAVHAAYEEQAETDLDGDEPDDGADAYYANYPDDGLTDVEADADALRGAGYGTDEDYGYHGDGLDLSEPW